MARVTVTEIDDFWTNDVSQSTKDTSIGMANTVVNRELQGEGVPESTLTDIELFLAIHIAKVEQPDAQSMADTAYVHPPDLNGLRETREGRRAIMFDPTGKLAASAKPRAKLRSFGPTHDS